MTIEEIIRDKNREFSSSHSEKSPFDREVFTRDSTERKIKAAHYFAPLLKEKFSSEYPTLDFEELAAELTVISKKGPDSVNYHFSFLYAVAIFILDSIYHSTDSEEKMSELRKILTDLKLVSIVDDDAFECFDELFRDLGAHPIYPDEMIVRLSSLLAFRNADFISYRKEKSHNDCYSFIADIYTTSLDKSAWNDKERRIRACYETILSLVNENDITDAVEEYEKLLFDLSGRYIKCRERMRRKRERLNSRKEYLNFKMDEEMLRNVEYCSEKEEIMTSLLEVEDELLSLKKVEDSFPDVFTLGLFSLIDAKNKYVTPLNETPDCDPYKVVSAFFFLFDKGDDRAWLLGPAMAVIGHASNRLPWSDPVYKGNDDNVRDALEAKAKKDVLLSPSFYSAVPGLNDISFSGATFDMTAAKYIYNAMDVIPSRYYPEVPDRPTLNTIMSENLLLEFEAAYGVSFSECHRLYYDPFRFSYSDYLSERIGEKESELKETREKLEEAERAIKREKNKGAEKTAEKEFEVLREQLERMTENLSIESSLLSKAKEEIRRLKREHRNEKEELNSLRELIFSRDTACDEEDDENQNDIDYPYQTEHEIIVIGGHSDWLKKMKKLLPSVKFYGDRVPDKEALKHTDVLWFQTYSGISHSAFYKAVDILKNLDVSIKYCPTSGIYRSVAEIVKDDKVRG